MTDGRGNKKVGKSGRRLRIFSALEVSNICGVVNQTVINWIRNGYLKAFTTPGGQYRVYAKDLFAFLDKRGMEASVEALHLIMESTDGNTILIVSGNSDLNGKVAVALNGEFADHVILQAFNGFDAGRKVASHRPGVIILDSALPGIDSRKLVALIREDVSFGKPFIILMHSGKGGNDSGAAANEKPDAVIPNPPDVKRLFSLIREAGAQSEASGAA